MRKRRKFADGGVTDTAQQPTYPFYGNQPQAGGASGGVNQTFNMQPQASAGLPEQQYAKGGQAKVGKVMREFKSGKLKSSSGQKVTNPKQAIAIGLSEAGLSKKAKGGEMKESKAMVKKEVSFMKKKGAPKSMLKHEMKEAGMKDGGKVKRMMFGGAAKAVGKAVATKAAPKQMPSQAGAAPTPQMAAAAYKKMQPVQGAGQLARSAAQQAAPTFQVPAGMRSFVADSLRKAPTQSAGTPPKPMQSVADAYRAENARINAQKNAGTPPKPKPMQTLGAAGVPARGISRGDLKMAGLMKKGGAVKKMASGGLAAGHKAADGVAKKGKTKAMQVKMAGGKGMKKGGYC